MKATFLSTAGLLTAVLLALPPGAAANPGIVNLGSAGDFAILAGSAITDVPGSSTIVTGNAGLYPGTSIGLTAGQVLGGTIYAAGNGFDGLLVAAKNDLTTAYNDAALRPASVDYGVVDNQLGGAGTLFPGVYRFGHAATANLLGTLTLDARNNPDSVWIFQATSDLITGSDSTVALINGAQACHVFWEVGSSATIGTNTNFVGSILADQSIALQTGATLEGRALARIAAVTLDHNTITNAVCAGSQGPGAAVPDGGSTLVLLGSGLATLLIGGRRFLAGL
jgi:Ice-binding-like